MLNTLEKDKIFLVFTAVFISIFIYFTYWNEDIIHSNIDVLCFLITFILPYIICYGLYKHIKKCFEERNIDD